VNLLCNKKAKGQMKTVNFFKKRGRFFSLVASLGFSLVFFPQLSLSEQGSSPPAPEQKPMTESSPSVESQQPMTRTQVQQQKDVTPPKLVNILVSPETLDVTARPAPITVTLQLTDDISGVKEWRVIFIGPSGTKLLTISGNPGLATGSNLNGIFQGTSALPQFSESGVWYATVLIMTDNAGNTAKLNLADAGFPVSFVMIPMKTPPSEVPTQAEKPEKQEKAVTKEEQAAPGTLPVQEQVLPPVPPEVPPPVKQPEQAAPGTLPVQEQVLPPIPPEVPPPVKQPEQAAPGTPPVQEQAPPPIPPAVPPPVKQPEKAVAKEENTIPLGPPVQLTLKQAIKAALTGNRPFLDALDSIRQQQGLGQVGGDQIIQVPGGVDIHIPVSTISGVAAQEAQFQTTLTPSFSVSRGRSGSITTQNESYSLNVNKPFITGGSVGLTTNVGSDKFEDFSSSLTANFSQPLLRGAWPFVVGEPIALAKSQLLQAELNAECCEDKSRQKLIFDVISQYYGIKNQLELVAIAKKAVERATRLFKATEAKQNVELATQLDVSRAEVQLSTQQRALNQALQDLGNKEDTFKPLLGLDAKETLELTDDIVYQPSEEIVKEEDLPKLTETAMKNRPDLRSEQLKVDDASRALRIARNGLLPELDSNFTYSVSNVGGLSDIQAANSKSWSGILTLSYPLPLTNTNINIESDTVSLRREQRTLLDKQEGIKRDIKTDLRNVLKSREQISIVKEQIESAEKKLKIANFRFDRGLASNFDIIDAENNLIQARQNLTTTIVDFLVARSQLKRDMGVLAYQE